MSGPSDPQDRAEEDRQVIATRRMTGVVILLLLAAAAGLLTWMWVDAIRTPSSSPARQVQIGNVCPDPTRAP